MVQMHCVETELQELMDEENEREKEEVRVLYQGAGTRVCSQRREKTPGTHPKDISNV